MKVLAVYFRLSQKLALLKVLAHHNSSTSEVTGYGCTAGMWFLTRGGILPFTTIFRLGLAW